MSLSNYEASVNGSFEIIEVTFNISGLGYNRIGLDIRGYWAIKIGVNRIVMARWIIPSRSHVPISRLEELKRLEVTERVLNEL
jgi:hypothetical protein